MSVFFRFIRLQEVGTVWASGFLIRPLSGPHGHYSAIGEFRCCK
jgi:hypothetical protein